MTTPVLSKNQQRKSLSAKKGPVKGLKNVLAQPYDNYWPLLKNDDDSVLENSLIRLLPSLKRPEAKIPWSQLRKMGKSERSAARKEAQEKCHAHYDETIASSVIFGINAITRLMEKDDVSCILLEASVDPSLLVKHIIVMARNKKIPILLISFLKKITLETVGFATAAIALKKDVKASSENYFYELFEKISEIWSKIAVLKTPVTLFQDKTLSDEKTIQNQTSVQNMEVDNKEDIVKSCNISTDLYLYRTSTKERVFEPSNSSKEKQNVGKMWTDFIALDNDNKFDIDKKKVPLRFFECVSSKSDKVLNKKTKKVMGELDDSNVLLNKDKVSYKPLKVKRIQGNQLRIKATKSPKMKKK